MSELAPHYTAGLLSWLFLHRSLTKLRWAALLLVTIGATTSQLSASEGGDIRAFTAPWEGYALGAIDSCLSVGHHRNRL